MVVHHFLHSVASLLKSPRRLSHLDALGKAPTGRLYNSIDQEPRYLFHPLAQARRGEAYEGKEVLDISAIGTGARRGR